MSRTQGKAKQGKANFNVSVINREILLTLGHANVEQFVANKLRLER
jgi:hypothetical protein